VTLGGLSLPSGNQSNEEQKKETPKFPVRGKAREYSQGFEMCWKAYGRKDQKFEAFGVWIVRAREIGGETLLVTLILGALKWQAPLWAKDGWTYAPYFERYLKRRKWEDEPPPRPQAVPRHIDDSLSKSTDRKIAALNAHADRRATPEELAELRRGTGR
jgi:hypothetical protein